MVDFPIRKREFRVCGWSGAFWEPLERKKEKTKCIYKICILLATLIFKILQNFEELFQKFRKISGEKLLSVDYMWTVL